MKVLPRFVGGTVPHGYVVVDAARLLLILARFAWDVGEVARSLRTFPSRPVAKHFSPEYYLQKLDFLVRYPGYLAYELAALHKAGHTEATDRAEMAALVQRIVTEREPEIMTLPFSRFWHGAYERLDDVEAWWYARGLIFVAQESRGGARPQKHYFVTEEGLAEAARLRDKLTEAAWYAERVDLVHRFFKDFSASQVKELQYRHRAYREAQLREAIPDLSPEEIRDAFEDAFGEVLEADLD